MTLPFYKQLNAMDCGPTCLRMISKYYGVHYNIDSIREKAGYNKEGVSLLGISETAEKMGFRTRGVQISYDKLETVPLPAILHWQQNHFVVLTAINKKKVWITDPESGALTFNRKEFGDCWFSNELEDLGKVGTALLLEPSAVFFENEGDQQRRLNWGIITQYLKPNKWRLSQIMLSLLVSSVLQFIFPFLTQSMVDKGVTARNLSFINLILIAQLMLTLSNTLIDFIRSRLQMKVSSIINMSVLSDFWSKLIRVPVSYFDTRHTGDTLQRIGDNHRLQSFITGQAFGTVFSVINFLVYAIILIFYSVKIFIVFCIGNLIYFGWIQLFLGVRRKMNYESFGISAKENNVTLQLVQGMQEIRLNNAEHLRKWEWEDVQAKLFKLNLKGLNYEQWQSAGALMINKTKDILISFIVAKLVVDGQLTFGTMLAVQYIIGQLHQPVYDFINLSQTFQDAKISLERLNEIYEIEDEEPQDQTFFNKLPADKGITIDKLNFTYPGVGYEPVLRDITLAIPYGKVTAIVGTSGSGKTTLLKILLKIYKGYEGNIRIGEQNYRQFSPSFWRRKSGAVLQDGFIFNDTVARNIAVGDETINYEKLTDSCRLANILPFIETLPNGYNTKLGAEGVGISQGQRQRLLIARAIYKQPDYLFFDEATNALDANNEREIVANLEKFYQGRTVVVIAHRLSTVKNADKIVVLANGRVAEEGTHDELIQKRGEYHHLVKNQLELGN
ncbi:peptidase domain-containing ABC transporter [Pedobacter miscanthi]|uniref:peptidase domain-containing ABC transporter n=1 Tax=Pedobacter miscanthi TaxID=2259170 RepID=UPI0029316EC8|nr:peptidase domain-containing ABC transporter [Pedobacter miscanthi]